MAAGAHVFSVKARDSVGNDSDAVTFTWTIDRTVTVSDASGGTWAIASSANPSVVGEAVIFIATRSRGAACLVSR